MIYWFSGDYNFLYVDLDVVWLVGFDWFIFYGLVIYGLVVRLIFKILLDYDVVCLVGLDVWFLVLVYFGEIVWFEIWEEVGEVCFCVFIF